MLEKILGCSMSLLVGMVSGIIAQQEIQIFADVVPEQNYSTGYDLVCRPDGRIVKAVDFETEVDCRYELYDQGCWILTCESSCGVNCNFYDGDLDGDVDLMDVADMLNHFSGGK